MKVYRIHLFFFLINLFFLSLKSWAVPAYPFPIEVKQPNGEVINIRIRGDEFFHYMVSDNDFVIMQDAKGNYVYTKIDNGSLKETEILVTKTTLRSENTSFVKTNSPEFAGLIQASSGRRLEEKINQQDLRTSQETAALITGNMKGLVILANFKDKAFSVTNPNQAFNNLLNQSGYSENGGTGSARDFYMDNSSETFIPSFQILGPVTLPNNMSFYGKNSNNGIDQNPEQMIIDACNIANQMYPDLNFADYDNNKDGILDNIFVFYAGYNEAEGAPDSTIWPHKYSILNKNITIDGVRLATYACTSELKGKIGTSMAGIGTFVHEFGHVLGLPDLYDTDEDTNGQGPGISTWSTMDTGPYLNSGRTPPFFNGVELSILGWATPALLTPGINTQEISINPVSSDSPQFYRINTTTNDEYFLLESRKKESWDRYLSAEGMLVYHVDMTTTRDKTVIVNGVSRKVSSKELWNNGVPNMIGAHQCMQLIPANNEQPDKASSYSYRYFAGHPFPGNTDNTILSDTTEPALIAWNGEKVDAELSGILCENNTKIVRFNLISKTASSIFTGDKNTPAVYVVDNSVFFKNIEGNTYIEIYNINGNRYSKKTISENDLESIKEKGIYIVKLQTINEVFTHKILIK